MPQPLEQQRRSNPLTPCMGRGFALDQRQHHRTLRQPDDGARQPVEITARNDHFLAPEIGDDALLGATLLAYVLDQVDVGVGANALVTLFERLWHEVGCRAVLEELAASR